MPTLLLLTIEVRFKVAHEITIEEMKQIVDPLAVRMIKLGANHAITISLVTLAASAKEARTVPTLANLNSLVPYVVVLIISPTIAQKFKSINISGKGNNTGTPLTLREVHPPTTPHRQYYKTLSPTSHKGWSNNKTLPDTTLLMTTNHIISL